MELTLFKANFKVCLQACEIENTHFLQEYLKLSSFSQISKWKKLALRIDFDESEKIIFDLLLSLKEDILRLENSLEKNQELLPLDQESVVESLNFECLNFLEPILEKDKEYYLRFDLKKQKIAIFIKAKSNTLAKIVKMKPEDKTVFDAFVVEIQRQVIRNRKAKNE